MTHRWKIFAILAALYLLAYFYRVSMAVMAKDLVADLHLSASQLGTLSGIFFYAFALTQLPLGPLLDRFGGKRVVILTGLVTTCGLVVFGLATSYPAALAGRILIGAGSATVLMGALKVFTNWFDRLEFGRISGFIIAIGNLGNLTATAPLALAVSSFGWRITFAAAAVLQIAGIAIAQRLVVETPLPHNEASQLHNSRTPSPATALRQVFATPSYWLMSLLAFFWYANYMAMQGLWGGPYLMEVLGLTRSRTGFLLLATSVGFLSGCLFVGNISEKVFHSRKKTLLCGQFGLLCCMLLFLGPAEKLSYPLLLALFFLLGLTVSSGVAIYPFIRESFPTHIIGTALTAVNFFILLGAAVIQQVMGFYIERFPKTGTGYPPEAYHGAFLIPIAGLAIGLCLFLFVKDTFRSPTYEPTAKN